MDPFSALGFAPSFAMDRALVSERRVELNKVLHPDRYIGRPPGERRAALGRALEVNEAARRLTDPVTRAEALLDLLGCPISDQGAVQPAAAFLMEIMDLREELREVGRRKDAPKIEALSARVKVRQGISLAQLTVAFEQVGADFASETPILATEAWQAHVHALIAELRYFTRFFEEAEAFLDEMD
jgi:molecular chaperone HscB